MSPEEEQRMSGIDRLGGKSRIAKVEDRCTQVEKMLALVVRDAERKSVNDREQLEELKRQVREIHHHHYRHPNDPLPSPAALSVQQWTRSLLLFIAGCVFSVAVMEAVRVLGIPS